MRVLVACEYSGRVRDAFNARGHDALSCDILPTDVPGPHHQGDVLPLLREPWDLVIAFPPCTDLSWANGKYLLAKREDGRTARAQEFFRACLGANAPKVAVENPPGDSWRVRTPDQTVQPWMFGDPWAKKTCLWLKNLPLLEPDVSREPQGIELWVRTGSAPRGEKPRREGHVRCSKERALTFPGIARAMATQWGG